LLGLRSLLRWLLLFDLLAGRLERESLSLLVLILARLTVLEEARLTERAVASVAVMEGDSVFLAASPLGEPGHKFL
jgi:hypothetical protein